MAKPVIASGLPHPRSQRSGLGVAIFAAAGIYQLTPWKEWCLGLCRSPIGALVHYIGFNGRSRDLRIRIHHGATCVGCCWALMIVLIAVGVMNVPAMAALGVTIFTEKLWRHGKPFGQAIGILLLAAGFLAIWFSWLLPGLHASGMPRMWSRTQTTAAFADTGETSRPWFSRSDAAGHWPRFTAPESGRLFSSRHDLTSPFPHSLPAGRSWATAPLGQARRSGLG